MAARRWVDLVAEPAIAGRPAADAAEQQLFDAARQANATLGAELTALRDDAVEQRSRTLAVTIVVVPVLVVVGLVLG
nr:hypothetical protein [Micromonospora sp. DSM 115978]